jgi:HSP20 family protein
MEKDMNMTKRNSEAATRTEPREDHYQLPLADIYETSDAYLVALDMPGAQKESMRVRLEHGRLTVTASASHQFDGDGNLLHEETRTPGYARAFALGEGIDVSNVDAQYEDGVLTIKLFKNEELKPREIAIR